jgi:hypothetical protein
MNKQIITPPVIVRWILTVGMIALTYKAGQYGWLLVLALAGYVFYELYWWLWREAVENKRNMLEVWLDRRQGG